MEVHHTHHPMHKKKWSEYILEFVMLFAAVTMGFFAENVREHMAEKEKKRELMKIVALDLHRDIKQLEFHKEDANLKMVTCDSIFPVFKMDPRTIDLRLYYHLLLNHVRYWDFNANNKSRNEADAKGYFRDEENEDIAYNISKVDFFILDYKTLDEESVRLRSKLKEVAEDLTEHEYYNKFIAFEGDLLPNKIGIKPFDKKAAIKASYLISNFKLNYVGQLGDIDSVKKYGNIAIELINKKYN